MTTRPATAVRTATSLRAAWVKVPCFFCLRVWVGWRMRMPWIRKRRAAELSSWKYVLVWRLVAWMGLTG